MAALPLVTVADVLGAMLVEICFACALYGITTIQSFIYYQTSASRKDTRNMKLTVGAVWFLESLHTAFCIHLIYEYTIQHFGDYDFLEHINWGAGTTVLLSVLVSALVHGFYLKKVWITTKGSILVTAPLAILAIARFASGIASFGLSLENTQWRQFRFNISPFVAMTIGLACAAAVDIAIALTLVYQVWRAESKGERPPGNRVDVIIAYVIETGSATALFSLLSVVMFIAQRHSLVFLGFIEMQTKLYANALLASLNVRALTSTNETSTSQLGTYQLRHRRTIPRLQFRSQDTIANVTIFRETVIVREDNNDRQGRNESDDRDSKSTEVAVGSPDDGKGKNKLV
ncbi:hypothetical protein C8Q76DRAFT_760479 [Earliella scabrosa]|nr:hypothetical protein C8Q76DRAFT_760479 [Earliella scabrosa]